MLCKTTVHVTMLMYMYMYVTKIAHYWIGLLPTHCIFWFSPLHVYNHCCNHFCERLHVGPTHIFYPDGKEKSPDVLQSVMYMYMYVGHDKHYCERLSLPWWNREIPNVLQSVMVCACTHVKQTFWSSPFNIDTLKGQCRHDQQDTESEWAECSF